MSALLEAFRAGGQAGLVAAIEQSCRRWLDEHGWSEYQDQIYFRAFSDAFHRPPRGWPVATLISSDNGEVVKYLLEEGAGDFWGWGSEQGLLFEHMGEQFWGWYAPNEPELAGHCDLPLSTELHQQQSFDWYAHLVAPDYTRIYQDVLTFFGDNPDRLSSLHWRAFEEICASIFTAQGYTTVLGPGANDGGIDIRLTDHPIYGEQLTVVSVKRRTTEKISLELVASILGVAHAAGSDRSMFITSNTFLPSARKFAATNRSSIPLVLADGQDVATWCRDVTPDPQRLREQVHMWTMDGAKIVVATVGYNCYYPQWAAVVAETATAARLIEVPSRWVSGDWMYGQETPDLDGYQIPPFETSFTARRRSDGTYYSDEEDIYVTWDGQPRWSTHAD